MDNARKIKESQFCRKNLNECYKKVYKCHFCKKPYGSDDKKEKHKICPICSYTLLRGKSPEEKKKLLLKSVTKPLNRKQS